MTIADLIDVLKGFAADVEVVIDDIGPNGTGNLEPPVLVVMTGAPPAVLITSAGGAGSIRRARMASSQDAVEVAGYTQPLDEEGHDTGQFLDDPEARPVTIGGRVYTIGKPNLRPGDGDLDLGVCPDCRAVDGMVNIGQGHWCYCLEHRVKWFVGANLFSSLRDETEEEQRARYARLGLGEFARIDISLT